MFYLLRLICLNVFFLSFLPSILFCQDLDLYTENYPPYNYEQNGTIQGINTELLLQAAKRAKLDINRSDIKVVPWARAFSAAKNNADACVYTTMRTEEREPYFTWVGPLVNTEKVLVALRGSGIEIDSLQDVQKKGYVVGVVIEDVCEHLLRRGGVPEDNLQGSHSALLNLRKLKRARIDLVAYDELTLKYVAKQNDIDPSTLKTVYVFGSGDHYLACNPETNSTVLSRLQNALDELTR
jgi:ABC-type amino acid transport substrate-binding protein